MGFRSFSVFPGSDMGVIGIIAEGLTVGCLVFFSEVCSAGFFPGQRIEQHQPGQAKEILDPKRLFQFWIWA